MMGDMEDCGRLPGRIKLAGEGGRPYLQRGSGMEDRRRLLKRTGGVVSSLMMQPG
jgi:hypothetical protein